MSSISKDEYLRFIKEGGIDNVYFHDGENKNTFSKFTNNKEIVLEAIKSCSGQSIVHVVLGLSEELKNDKDVILEAVKKDGYSLSCASEELRNDPGFVCECIKASRSTTSMRADDYIGNQLCESSLFAKKIKKNRGDFEASLEEFEIEEFETKYQRNETDQYFIDYFLDDLKRGDVHNDNRLRVTGMELQEKLEEKFLSLHTHVRIDGDDNKYLERMKRELYESDRDLFEDVKKWKINAGNLTKAERLRRFTVGKKKKMVSRLTLELRERFKQQNICFMNFSFFRVLGRGANGSAYLSRINGIPGLVVIKLYPSQFLGNENRELEKDSLYLDDHPNVAPILFHKKKEEIDLSKLPDYDNYWKEITGGGNQVRIGGMLVMKYHKISLQKWMNYRMIGCMTFSRTSFSLSPKELGRVIARGILLGVQHLHKNMIVHRDLHPGNIFVHPEEGRVLIGDFGCSLDLRNNPKGFKVHKKHEILFNVTGSYLEFNKTGGESKYCSPEIRNFNPTKDGEYLDYSKSDVYSVGVLIRELVGLMKQYFDPTDDHFWLNSSRFRSFVQLLVKDFKDRISINKAAEIIEDFERRENFYTVEDGPPNYMPSYSSMAGYIEE